MKILLMMDKCFNAGSIQAASNYVRASAVLGHTIMIYGRPNPKFPELRFSTDVDAFDFVLFIIESALNWMSGLRMPVVLSGAPRERRAILDADGMYNEVISI